MTARYLHQTLALSGGFEFLRRLESTRVTSLERHEILSLMELEGIENPVFAVTEFLAAGVLSTYGERIGLSTFGIRMLLLLEAINGADLKLTFERLSQYDSTLRAYQLVREGMTSRFLRSLAERPGLGAIYVCSPWINLDRKDEQILLHAVTRETRRGRTPDIFIITRPTSGDGLVPDGVHPFQALGGTIFLHGRLHTKLYIREPGANGGYTMAIIGSQNLTRSQYLELGILIDSDSVMVRQLIRYFWELSLESSEV